MSNADHLVAKTLLSLVRERDRAAFGWRWLLRRAGVGTRAGGERASVMKQLCCDALVPMVQAAKFGRRYDATVLGRLEGPRHRAILCQRQMRARTHVQVDKATPIVLDRSVNRGIRGLVGLSRCTRR